MTDPVRIRLFVAGHAPSGERALTHLNALLDELGADRGLVERVDVLIEPQRALDAKLFATPTLLVEMGEDTRVYVGDTASAEAELRRLLG